MFRTLTIEGYRGIKKLTLDNLARVNLLVGQNNCGKTSVLEAIELMVSDHPADALLEVCHRRGDVGEVTTIAGSRAASVSLGSAIHGYSENRLGSISIKGEHDEDNYSLEYRPARRSAQLKAEATRHLSGIHTDWQAVIGMDSDGYAVENELRHGKGELGGPPVAVITTNASVASVRTLISEAKADGRGPLLVKLLSRMITSVAGIELFDRNDAEREQKCSVAITLDPSIKNNGKLAYQQHELKTFAELGYGSWQMLAALSGICAASGGGVLLIDEIDTGIHHSRLADLWRALIETSVDEDVQVFATTHSKDCLRGLAEAAESLDNPSVGVQRIDAGKVKAVRYSSEELVYAAMHGVEMR